MSLPICGGTGSINLPTHCKLYFTLDRTTRVEYKLKVQGGARGCDGFPLATAVKYVTCSRPILYKTEFQSYL
jgi:hypothetical protein